MTLFPSLRQTPLHVRLRVSRAICYSYSELGRRRTLAGEQRLRRLAMRLGLRAEKTRRNPGGWQIRAADGVVICGPGLSTAMADEALRELQAEACS
ncbi:hypothetical protein [Rhizobium sp. FKL33]|uniref:hypothetical protein n=1 Tax=Rhizobium sp. FKL33 TaxID=2562307 RepID=UPI0010C102C6|nr:hypothetical protein [Rhizobium sp. FKL33]